MKAKLQSFVSLPDMIRHTTESSLHPAVSDDPNRRTADDDNALFRLAMLGVRRHRPTARAGTNKPAPQPIARQRQLDELDVLRELLADTEPDEIERGDTLHYRVPGVQDAVMRRLRRRHYPIGGQLHLHGHNRDRAKLQVQQ